jgi:predicted aspartyl protease
MIYSYSFDAPKIVIEGVVYQQSRSQWLALTGPVIPVTINNVPAVIDKLNESAIKVEPIKIRALVDSGAAMCVVSQSIVDKLHLHFEKYTEVGYVQGGDKLKTYAALIKFDWGVEYFIPVVACTLDSQFEMLIGRDILSHWDISYNGKEGIITINDTNVPSSIVNIFTEWLRKTFGMFFLAKTKGTE